MDQSRIPIYECFFGKDTDKFKDEKRLYSDWEDAVAYMASKGLKYVEGASKHGRYGSVSYFTETGTLTPEQCKTMKALKEIPQVVYGGREE
jgi:hypothetical protein